MNWQAIAFDWNQARAFLATAEEGSLSAAARALGLTQPTLGRQVTALEERLGIVLFERGGGRNMTLTTPGLELLEHFRAMGAAAERISLTATGQSQTIEGSVRITATDVMSAYFLPEAIEGLRQKAPGLHVEIIAENDIADIRRREADIALRNVRPNDPDLIAKLVYETEAHLYATPAFLKRLGQPHTIQMLNTADFINYGDAKTMIRVLNAQGLSLTEANFPLTTRSIVTGWELVKRGLGIGTMGREVAARTPEVVRVTPGIVPFQVPLWLTTHRELRTSRRIRLVFDHLAEAIAEAVRESRVPG